MRVCWCSLAGTRACFYCQNNSLTIPPFDMVGFHPTLSKKTKNKKKIDIVTRIG